MLTPTQMPTAGTSLAGGHTIGGPAAAGPSAPTTGSADPGAMLTPQAVMAKMQLNPQQQQQLQRIIVAGKKVMFSPQSHKAMMQQMLQIPGDLPTKVGTAVAGLMGLLMQQSQNSIPKNLVIPAGIILTIDAFDFLKKAGQQVQPRDLGTAIQVCVHAILKAANVDPDKVAAMGAQAGGDPSAAAPAGPPPSGPPGLAAPAQPPAMG